MERAWSRAQSGSALGRADLHVHSSWSDGAQCPEDVVRAAGRVDVLAVTDHDGIAGALRAREFAREHPTLGVEVVVGEEVSTLNGHLLALYLEEAVPAGLPADRTIELIHAQGGLAIPAHPFHPIRYRSWGQPSLATLIPDLPLDGIEVVNNSGFSSHLYDARAAFRNAEWMLAVTGGSDAHDVAYLGSAVTRFEGRNAAALRHALLERRTRAHLEWTWSIPEVSRHFAVKVRTFRPWLHFEARCPRQPVDRAELSEAGAGVTAGARSSPVTSSGLAGFRRGWVGAWGERP